MREATLVSSRINYYISIASSAALDDPSLDGYLPENLPIFPTPSQSRAPLGSRAEVITCSMSLTLVFPRL